MSLDKVVRHDGFHGAVQQTAFGGHDLVQGSGVPEEDAHEKGGADVNSGCSG